MVIGFGGDGDRVEPGRGRFVVAEPGPGGGLVEDLHDLGAQAARELPVAAEGVLPGDPALLVRGGAQRQVGFAEQPVVGDHAVPGGEHIGQVCPHAAVDRDRALDAEGGPGFGCQGGLRPHPDDDQHHVGRAGHGRATGCGGLDMQAPGLAGGGAGDRLDRGARQHLDAVSGQFGVDQRAELRVHGGQHLGQLLHLGNLKPADGQGIGHLQADVPGADDDRGAGRGLLQGLHDGEGVAHRVQQVHPIGGAQGARPGQAADRGPDRDRAGTDDELVVAEHLLTAPGGGEQELAAGHVDAPGRGVGPQPHSRGFQVGDGAVGEVAPVGDLTGEVVGDAADGEVRVGVLQDHGDVGGRVELAGSQGGADTGVAAADHDQVHGRLPF